MKFRIESGFPEQYRRLAAHLFWLAFRDKLKFALGPEDKAIDFIAANLQPGHALSAIDRDGALLGLAGYKTLEGGFLTGNFGDLARVYGQFGALWRGTILDMFDRDLEDDALLMDGIFVAGDHRGKGVGTALLDAIVREARSRGKARVLLDVVIQNTKAKSLYERFGFVQTRVEKAGLLEPVLGFKAAARMEFDCFKKTDPGPAPKA